MRVSCLCLYCMCIVVHVVDVHGIKGRGLQCVCVCVCVCVHVFLYFLRQRALCPDNAIYPGQLQCFSFDVLLTFMINLHCVAWLCSFVCCIC